MTTVKTVSASRAAGSQVAKPTPDPSVMQPAADRIARAGPDAADELLPRRPEYLAQGLPGFARYSSYFSSEVRGQDNLPTDGPALVIANHSGHYSLADA